jgi:hypothetical protein
MSSASSSSSSSSASPEPEPRPQKKTKTKSKAAEAAKAKKNAERGPAQGKDEGADPHWAYKPPNKSVLLEDAADVEEFDWDALDKDEDLELWVVRIPEGVGTIVVHFIFFKTKSPRWIFGLGYLLMDVSTFYF